MILKDISIDNFLSFGEGVRVKLSKRGLVLIEGENRDDASAASNGAGKTSLIDAVVWALEGTTTRGYEGDDVVNNNVGKNCAVQLIALTDDKRKVVISRYRKHSTYKDALVVTVDGVDVSKGGIKETQKVIDGLVGFNEKTLLSCVVFGQTPGYRFSRLTDSEQKKTLDDALGIAQYAAACDAARKHMSELRPKYEAATEKLEDVRADVAQTEASLEELRGKSDTYKSQIAEQVRDKEGALAVCKREMQAIKKKLSGPSDRDSTQRKEYMDERTELTEKLGKLRTKLGSAKSGYEVAVRKYEALAKRIKAEEKSSDAQCDTCGQAITAKSRRAHIEALQEQQAEARREEKAAEGEERSYNEKIATAKKRLADIEEEIERLNTAIGERSKREGELRGLERDAERLEAAIKELAKSDNPYHELIEKAEKKLDKLKESRKELKEKVAKLESKLALYEFWVDGFGTKGLRSYLIDTALPYLNERAAEYADTLTAGNVEVTFKTQSALKGGGVREKFEVDVVNIKGAHSYKGNSAGETGKIDLIVGLALQSLVASRVGSKINVAFFDEPFEHVDASGVERVIELLNDRTKQYESVLVVTHNDALKDHFTDSITVIKEDGFSRIEES